MPKVMWPSREEPSVWVYSHGFPQPLFSLSLTYCVPFWLAPSHLKVSDMKLKGLLRVMQAAAEPRSSVPLTLPAGHPEQYECECRRPVPTLSPPGPGLTLTVAQMWVWASRSSCLSPSVSVVMAYLVAL